MSGQGILVDARQKEVFDGKVLTEGAYRKGHIPGAVNIPWTEHFDCNGHFKSVDELRKLYTAHGITSDKNIITYCHSGFQSTVNYFVLTGLLGYPNVKNYDASWIGWSKDEQLPIANNYSSFFPGKTFYELKGIKKVMDAAPYIKEGRIFIPLRYLALTLGVPAQDIQWDGSSVTLKKGNRIVKVSIGEKILWNNGIAFNMDVEAEITTNGRVMIPGRLIAEAFGAQVDYDQNTETISIYTQDTTTAIKSGGT